MPYRVPYYVKWVTGFQFSYWKSNTSLGSKPNWRQTLELDSWMKT